MKDNIKFEVIKKLSDVNFKYRELGRQTYGGINKIDSNSPPSVFIGSKLRYPAVNVGILSPLERDDNAWVYDDEKYWAEKNFGIRDVIKLRDSLLNSRFRSKVSSARSNSSVRNNRFIEMAKDIAMASRSVDLEIELKNSLRVKEQKDRVTKPHGMKASLKKAKITSNVNIHRKIDKVVNDDLKTAEGMEYLYKNNFDEYTLSKILSVGALGMKKNRRLVPTRWSITTTDDILGKRLINRVRDYKWIENYELYVGGFMGNYYLIFLFPGVWSYELFELYLPGSAWNPSTQIKASTDYENYYGRKNYASNTAGGYYASRLPILKKLDAMKRQASVLVIRLETPSYWAALGVWVCRESTKKVMDKQPFRFNSDKEMVSDAKKILSRFSFGLPDILKRSKLLVNLNQQKRLSEFF